MSAKTRLVGFGAALCLAASATPASAELVFLTSGRTLSVKGHRIDGDSIVLTLRSGGQVTCDRSLIDRIEADEVPYPDPPVITDRDATDALAQADHVALRRLGEELVAAVELQLALDGAGKGRVLPRGGIHGTSFVG